MEDDRKTEKPEADREAVEQTEKTLSTAEEARIRRAKIEAEAAGGGPDKPEEGLNPDG